MRIYTRDFLRNVYQDYFGLDFDELTRIEFIEDDEIRQFLKDTNLALNQGSIQEAGHICISLCRPHPDQY